MPRDVESPLPFEDGLKRTAPRRSGAGIENKNSVNHMRKPRLLLADDHAIVLEGLSRLLEPEFEVVGKAGDGRAMLEIAARLKPDVIIVDVSMPLLSGIEAVRQLKRKDARVKVIVLSMHSDVELGSEALRAGASGYVLKHSAAETLHRAIHKVLDGEMYVSPRLSIDVLSAVHQSSRHTERPVVTLTQREREVLQLVAEGRTIRGISNILRIAVRTVVFHKGNLRQKLGLHTTAELTCYAIQCGLLAAPGHS
jgi:DNA-binding NarL/FixJ family response regulator